MINPEFDAQRRLESHFKWELECLAKRLKKHMFEWKFDLNELIRERVVSASSLAAFLNSHQPIEIATLIMLTQHLGFNLYLDFRPSGKASRVSVSLISAKDEDIVRGINSGFRSLLKGKQVKSVAEAARLSVATVYNFTRVIPEKSFVPIQVTVPDLLTVFKCARGCGYETYLMIEDQLLSIRCAGW
jgi:hypothetical protein